MKFSLSWLSASLCVLIFSMFDHANADEFISCNQQPEQWQDVSGEWVASVGPVILTVDGTNVSGIYNQNKWSLDLKYSDDLNTLYGRWSHRNGLEGPVIFQLNENGCIRHAKWGGVGKHSCLPSKDDVCVNDWAFHGRKVQ